MQVGKGKVVSFHYRLKDANDNLLEESHGGEPTAYLHGNQNILPAMEAELEGKQAGDSLQISLTPDQAYGEYNPEAVQRVPLKRILGKENKNVKLQVGQILSVDTDKGPRQVRVVKVGKFNVDLDTNHPLAGVNLNFDVEIVEVRDATEEEVSHGHAHGPGGHHH
jgi:FKBP-type peptidyl-prolyl cis-trans isomerase SlyD